MPSTLSTSPAVGIDVGATHTRVGVVTGAGRTDTLLHEPTRRRGDAGAFLVWIDELVLRAQRGSGFERNASLPIGLALPATLDAARTTVVRCVNLPLLQGVCVREHLQCCHVMTDAEAATWREYVVRESSADVFAHLRLGTGVACGVVSRGELLRLDADRTTHPDFLFVDDGHGAKPCACGLRGCLETIASGPALQREIEARNIGDDVHSLQTKFQQGDDDARKLIGEVAQAVVKVAENLRDRFGVTLVNVGGGVVQRLPCLMSMLTVGSTSTAMTKNHADVAIEPSRQGESAGVIGAALLALKDAEN